MAWHLHRSSGVMCTLHRCQREDMLNFHFTQSLAINSAFQGQAPAPAAPGFDVVSALAESFAPTEKLPSDSEGHFGKTLEFVDARADRSSLKDAQRNDMVDSAKVKAVNRRDWAREQESITAAGADGDAVNQAKQPNDDQSFASKENASVSANDNHKAAEAGLEAEKIMEEVKEVIDQIDLALASGAGQISPEMAALLASLKELLQQIMMQFNQAIDAGAVEGTDTVLLDGKAFAPLLKQLDALVESLKNANAALAERLGLAEGEAGSEIAGEAEQAVSASDAQGAPNQNGLQRAMQAHFLGVEQRAAHIASKLDRAMESDVLPKALQMSAGSTPLKTVGDALLAAQEAASLVEQQLSVGEGSADSGSKEKQAQPVQTPIAPTVSQPTQSAAWAAPSATNGNAGQFGSQSGQGQSQSSANQTTPIQPLGGTQAAAKDATSFESLVRQPAHVRGSASEQVVFQMKSMIKDGVNKMIVKLDPPELGELEIRMQINRAGHADVMIQVERPQTLELLQKDARLLQQALHDAGMSADGGSLSFNLRGENNSGGRQQGHNPYPVTVEDNFDEEILHVASATYVVEVEHGVNIHI